MRITRILLVLASAAVCASLCSCIGRNTEVKVDIGSSELFSEQDRRDAADVIKKEFTHFEGCTLNSLTFAGDDACSKEAESPTYSDEKYDEYIVFRSSFRSPKNGGGAWTADTEYTWSWILARNGFTAWRLVNYGYC